MPDTRSTRIMGAALILLVALSAWLLGSRGTTPVASAAEPASTDRAREGVLVSGTGKVLGMPDTLRADFGADARGETVDAALRTANSALGRIRDALVDRGVAEADIQTAGIEIYPRYARGGAIIGYQVSHQLTVKIRDLDKAGATIGAAVDAGGNAARLSGVSFAIEDDDTLLAEARRQAFADAKAKASLYGEQAGRQLGPVVSVTETVRTADVSRESFRADAAVAAIAVPIEPGQQQLAVTVTVEWAFR
ncbi:MAG: SIMPL domain-containing protein [Actinomycetes bacterium]